MNTLASIVPWCIAANAPFVPVWLRDIEPMEGATLFLVVSRESLMSLLDELEEVNKSWKQKGIDSISALIKSRVLEMFNVIIRHRGKLFHGEDAIAYDGKWDRSLRAYSIRWSDYREDMSPINTACTPLEILEGFWSSFDVVLTTSFFRRYLR